ncbi:MAG: pyrroline-5-carboxylate reductase [Firmicutes bacterium]|nr:pyrroline-5-carboxylate reductase [Bacillota bacterium]
MKKTIGAIGGGNMGSAIIGGIINKGIFSCEVVTVSDLSEDNLKRLKDEYSVNVTKDNKQAAKSSILLLCVKPNMIADVIDEIKDVVNENTIIVSIAAGKTIGEIERLFGKKIKLVRVMPNTPALVGEGMAGLAPNENVTDDEAKIIKNIFDSLGKAEIISEKMMDVVTSVSGSSPAFVYMFIEAMADGAVLGGMPRAQAYKFAAQAVLGSAKMVLETGKHPGELKDMVCSPAGTTIEAVATLEKNGFRSAVIDAIDSCTEKSRKMTMG